MNNTFTNITANSNSQYGIQFYTDSDYNTINDSRIEFNGIRGFYFRGVSTRGVPTTVGGVPIAGRKKKDPIGSDWIFLANAEVTVPLAGEYFSALFFVDSGVIDSGGYRAAAGIGIQILIPRWFGPVPMRFELATPLMKDDEDDTQVFSFSIGMLF